MSNTNSNPQDQKDKASHFAVVLIQREGIVIHALFKSEKVYREDEVELAMRNVGALRKSDAVLRVAFHSAATAHDLDGLIQRHAGGGAL